MAASAPSSVPPSPSSSSGAATIAAASAAMERVELLEKQNAELTATIESLRLSIASGDKGAEIIRLQNEVAKLKEELHRLNQVDRKQQHMLFTMSREATMGSKKAGRGIMTMKRLAKRGEEVKVLREEITRWLNMHLALTLTADTMMDSLASGVILCHLALKIKADLSKVMGRVHENATPGSFFSHDNVHAFLKACAHLGVPPFSLFDSPALTGVTKDTRAVVHTLLRLAKAAMALGFEPPEVIKIEKEIDLLKKAKARGEVIAPKEDIHPKVMEFCKASGLPPPVQISPGEYKFGEVNPVVAHVVFVRGQPLVRHGDNWDELTSFILQRVQEDVTAKKGGGGGVTHGHSLLVSPMVSPSPSPRHALANEPITPSALSSEDKVAVVEPPPLKVPTDDDHGVASGSGHKRNESTASVAGHTDGGDGGGDGDGSDDDDGRPRVSSTAHLSPQERQAMEAKKEFFFLTALAVKLNSKLREDVVIIPTTELWHKAIADRVHFYQFTDWISNELVKSYLERSRTDRLANMDASNLRGQRLHVMSALQRRGEREAEIKAAAKAAAINNAGGPTVDAPPSPSPAKK